MFSAVLNMFLKVFVLSLAKYLLKKNNFKIHLRFKLNFFVNNFFNVLCKIMLIYLKYLKTRAELLLINY